MLYILYNAIYEFRFLIYVYVGVFVYMRGCLWRLEEGTGSAGAGVTGGFRVT